MMIKLSECLREDLIFFVIFYFADLSMAQNYQPRLWQAMSSRGRLTLLGQSRLQQTTFKNSFKENWRMSQITSIVELQSRSYVLHPNFLVMDINMNFQPTGRQEKFLVMPDRTETRTFERGRLQMLFFRQRAIKLSLFADIYHGFINREFITDVENRNRNFGLVFSLRNRYLPFIFNYSNTQGSQTERQSGRKFKLKRKIFQAEVRMSFVKYDEHLLSYSFNDLYRVYYDYFTIQNKIQTMNLRNQYSFGRNRQSRWQSFIWYHHQTGSDNFDRTQIYEALSWHLPFHFQISSNYQFSKYRQAYFSSQQNLINGHLSHRLFLSLFSNVYIENSNVVQSDFSESITRLGIAFQYQKSIPSGQLKLSYEWRLSQYERENILPTLIIIDEKHKLSDDQIVLLQYPYIDPLSVVISDKSGTMIYQENLDYVLIRRDNFIEVQRLPAGQITDGETVFIDYTAQQQPSYQYDSFNRNLGVSVILWQKLLEIYYRQSQQDYGDLTVAGLPVLKYYTRRVYGFQSSISSIAVGFEMDNFNSNIVPYHSRRLFINMSKNISSKLRMLIYANHRQYVLEDVNEEQKFSDISSKFIYTSFRKYRITIEGNYRFQRGRGIDLNLATFRSEFSTRFHNIYLSIGLDIYNRNFSGEKIDYREGYIKLERKF